MAKQETSEQSTMPRQQFEELNDGLMAMFRTCVIRQENGPDARKAGAQTAMAIMQLHRDFKPTGQ